MGVISGECKPLKLAFETVRNQVIMQHATSIRDAAKKSSFLKKEGGGVKPLRPNTPSPSSLMALECCNVGKKGSKKSYFFLNGPAL